MKEFVLLFRIDITNKEAQPTKKQLVFSCSTFITINLQDKNE